jgi:lipopolysaccharide export LptBFGC system permease protein LptF
VITLHAYFLRELLKTFSLATVALTLLLTMGGALYSLLRFEGLEARDVPLLTPLLLPVMLAVSMAVAGIFAACMTYGRFAADNELTACRAAGINVHRLGLAALLVGIFVALMALLSVNVLIPRIVITIENYARNNLGVLAASRLQSRSFIDMYQQSGGDWHLLTTESVERPTPEQLRAKGFEIDPRIHYLLVRRPRYLQRGPNNTLERFVSAEVGFCIFDARSNPVTMRITVKNAHQYDPRGGSVFIEEQTIRPFQFSFGTKLRSSFVDLDTLFAWLREPWTGQSVKDLYERFRAELSRYYFADFATRALPTDNGLRLFDDRDYQYDVTAKTVAASPEGLALDGVVLHLTRNDGVPLSRYEAARAILQATPPRKPDLLTGGRLDSGEVTLRLRLIETADTPVQEFAARATSAKPLGSTDFSGLRLPAEVTEAVEALSPQQTMDSANWTDLPEPLKAQQQDLVTKARGLTYNVKALINMRFALALALLASVLIAATLGAAFKGAQALSAFALSCIPAFVVALVMNFAKDIAQRPSTHTLGLWVMWGGLGVILLLQQVLLRSLVKR